MRFEPGYSLARSILIPWLGVWFRKHYEGLDMVPAKGPVIIAVNHISLFDPIIVAHAVDATRRRPRFLGKASLFKAPVVGWILRSAKQIRVDRGTPTAPMSLEHAEAALRDGQAVVIFPEGTTTTNPDLSPLHPKTGLARLALATGSPVIPCATWGGQWFWSYHLGLNAAPGKDIWVRFGNPVDLHEYRDQAADPQAWESVGKIVMDEIAVLLAGLRAAKPWTPTPIPERALKKKARSR